ncbi:ComF family protein [Sporolactobacillus nakayamae]|uniref:Competence protein ComFC n=1 Tax=Sporolactobacillus nakayamae TaxID=269670 RepID=A0A1I2UEK3_9BACL|nr:ComF family protein [Sporolactobacillus nakayamae]SFG73081.1 competence protein ComFC [Sporolactobacillus nakayamae]
MALCLFCNAERREPLTFRTLLSPETEAGFCPACRDGLKRINRRNNCLYCGRDLSLLDQETVRDRICRDCVWWRKSGRNGLYVKNYSVFSYNEFIKEIINQFKFRGDSILADGFACDLRKTFQRIKKEHGTRTAFRLLDKMDASFIIVPIPLSAARLAERGFNQAEVLAEKMGAPVTNALVRDKHEPKQSKKNRRERLMERVTPFRINADYASLIEGGKVLLIDDIYTTGATIRLAAEALAQANPIEIDSLTLIHG